MFNNNLYLIQFYTINTTHRSLFNAFLNAKIALLLFDLKIIILIFKQ